MKRALLAYHRYLHDEPIRLARIVGRERDAQSQARDRFRYAPAERAGLDERSIVPDFSRALRHGPHLFLCGPRLYHNVNSRQRKLEKDTAREYTLVFELPHETFARRRSLNRTKALEAARLLDEGVNTLDIYHRLFSHDTSIVEA